MVFRYSLLKMVIFHCHVSLLKGISTSKRWRISILKSWSFGAFASFHSASQLPAATKSPQNCRRFRFAAVVSLLGLKDGPREKMTKAKNDLSPTGTQKPTTFFGMDWNGDFHHPFLPWSWMIWLVRHLPAALPWCFRYTRPLGGLVRIELRTSSHIGMIVRHQDP